MNDKRSYYEILHVQPDAPKEIIQSSYRTLMQQLNAHPDRGGDNQLAALINRAYAVLTNDTKRSEYDRELQKSNAESSATSSTGSYQVDDEKLRLDTACPFCKTEFGYREHIPKDAFCNKCKSPLHPAEHNRLDETGQRKMHRIGKRSSVSFYTRWPQLRAHSGTTENISQDGMMFITPKRLTVDTMLKIHCTQFQAIGRVVHCRQSGNLFDPVWQIGVEFLTMYLRSPRGMFVSDVT